MNTSCEGYLTVALQGNSPLKIGAFFPNALPVCGLATFRLGRTLVGPCRNIRTTRKGGEVDDLARTIFEAIADPDFVIEFTEDGLAPHFAYVNEATC
jgi:hypothetical protein